MQSTVARVVARVLVRLRRVLDRLRGTPQQIDFPPLGGPDEWPDGGEFQAAGVPRRPGPSSGHGSVALVEPDGEARGVADAVSGAERRDMGFKR